MELIDESVHLSNSEIKKRIRKQIKPEHRLVRDPIDPKYGNLFEIKATSAMIDMIMKSNAPLKVKSILLRDWNKIYIVTSGPDFMRKAKIYIDTHKKWLVKYEIYDTVIRNFTIPIGLDN